MGCGSTRLDDKPRRAGPTHLQSFSLTAAISSRKSDGEETPGLHSRSPGEMVCRFEFFAVPNLIRIHVSIDRSGLGGRDSKDRLISPAQNPPRGLPPAFWRSEFRSKRTGRQARRTCRSVSKEWVGLARQRAYPKAVPGQRSYLSWTNTRPWQRLMILKKLFRSNLSPSGTRRQSNNRLTADGAFLDPLLQKSAQPPVPGTSNGRSGLGPVGQEREEVYGWFAERG